MPPGDIRRSAALGGGALLDLGAYCVSAIRLFAGEPAVVHAEQVRDPHEGVDLRMAASLALPRGVLGLFDVGLDLTRRDQLELVGTEGRLTVPDPWLCRAGYVELERDGRAERHPADPEGAYGLTDPEHDVYRLELDSLSESIRGGSPPPFGREDALAQAATLEALRLASLERSPVHLR